MVNWELAVEDTYYCARRVEEKARNQGSADAWQEFADLKAAKGSYVLAVYGYLNGALLREQQGGIEPAFELFAAAFRNARRARCKELAVIVACRHALLAERAERWDLCMKVYQDLGEFCEELGGYFLAADAYEHVAEIMVKAGRDASAYKKPIELWERNARHWQELGQEDDARWSARHILLYQKLFGAAPA